MSLSTLPGRIVASVAEEYIFKVIYFYIHFSLQNSYTCCLFHDVPGVLQCFCSVDGDELDTGAGMCNYDCGGDAGQKCGGSGAITVYSYADGPGPTPVEETPAPAVPTPTGTHSFVGCYKDSPSARVLPVLIADSVTDLTTEVCVCTANRAVLGCLISQFHLRT